MQELLLDLRRHRNIKIKEKLVDFLKKKNCKFLSEILVLAFLAVIATGCGKQADPELESYKENMTQFYNKLSEYDSSINSIDPDSETAGDELLVVLDEMNETYKNMAAIEIPEEFSGISDIAVEAADYMDKANEFYHQAYDGDFDSDSEMLASQYYQRANDRVLIMLQVLHGQVPEGEGITVETESTYEISTIDDESTDGE